MSYAFGDLVYHKFWPISLLYGTMKTILVPVLGQPSAEVSTNCNTADPKMNRFIFLGILNDYSSSNGSDTTSCLPYQYINYYYSTCRLIYIQ